MAARYEPIQNLPSVLFSLLVSYRLRTSSQQPMLQRRSKRATYASNTFKELLQLMRDLCVSSTVKITSTVCIISRCTYAVAPVIRQTDLGRWPFIRCFSLCSICKMGLLKEDEPTVAMRLERCSGLYCLIVVILLVFHKTAKRVPYV